MPNIPKSRLPKCAKHHKACALYCPFCKQSICSSCPDIHYKSRLSYKMQQYLRNCTKPLTQNNIGGIQLFLLHGIVIQLNSLIKQFISNFHYQTNVIHYWRESEIIIFNPTNKQKTSIPIEQSLNWRADSISYKKYIFIMGGDLVNDVYKINTENKTLTPKNPLQIKKYGHSLCSYGGYIYSIGGYDYSKLDDCEEYNIKTDKWKGLPKLLTPRNYSAVFTFKNANIYCFCGATNSGYTNSMEKYHVGEDSWIYMTVKNPISERYDMHGIQCNSREIIVFGGNFISSVDSYLLLIDGDIATCSNASNLVENGCFYSSSAPIYANNIVYSVDVNRGIHIYSNNKWAYF